MVYGIIFEKLSLGQDGPIDWGKMGTAHLAPCYSAAHKSGESTKKEKHKKLSKPLPKRNLCVKDCQQNCRCASIALNHMMTHPWRTGFNAMNGLMKSAQPWTVGTVSLGFL